MKKISRAFLGKRLLSIFLCASMVLYSAVPGTARAAEPVPAGETIPGIGDTIVTSDGEQDNTWELVWQDEFNSGTLDTSKWGYQVGDGSAYGISGWGNNEKQYYTDDGNNVGFEDGKLVITAKKNTDSSQYGGAAYTSGRIWTKGKLNASEDNPALFAKKYGRFEAKITMPAGTGYWPAFWMMPAYDKYGVWALSGEIDIMEARGRLINEVGGTLHYGGTWPNNKHEGGTYNNAAFSITDEHIYALEWLPGRMRWYVDDILYYETSDWYSKPNGSPLNYTYPAPFDQEFYLMLNMAVGGDYDGGQLDPTLDGGQMKVDYVRVYDLQGQEYDENVAPPAETPDSLPDGVFVGSDLITGTFDSIKKITADYAGNSTAGWDLVCLTDFAGNADAVKQEDDSARISIQNPGNQSYSVQLIHKLPLTRGYRYEVSFEAKADASRTMEVKVTDSVTFSNYSDVVSTSLSTSFASYRIPFEMKSASTTGRLELNMGLSNIPVTVKNVSVKVLGLSEEISEDAPKEPLPNGEHIYNGTFDQGDASRMQFWSVIGGTGTVSPSVRALAVSGSAVVVTGSSINLKDVYAEQKGLNLLKNDIYRVTFDAKAENPGTVGLELLSGDGLTSYGYKEYTITDTQTNTFDLQFAMGGVTDIMASLRIYVGGNAGIVSLDNISMKRLTNNNVSYEGVKIYPVSNGDFAAGTAGWTVSQTDYGIVEEGGRNVCFAVGAKAANNYDRMLLQMGVDIAEGHHYTMNFKARTDSSSAQSAVIRIQREGGDWRSVLDTSFDLTDQWQDYTYTFTADFTGNLGLKYLLGDFTQQCRFYIKDVELYVTARPLLQGAFLAGTQPAPKASEDIVLKYYDKTGWESAANRKVTINAVPVDSSLVTLDTAAKTMTLKGELFPAAGSYVIQATADGYDSTNAWVQSVLESSGNLVVNGSFNTSLEGWDFWAMNGCGNASQSEGAAKVHFIWHEGNTWDLQLSQSNIPLQGGKAYALEFDAYATIRRPIAIELGVKNGADPLTTAVLETSAAHYKFRYDAPVSGGVKLNFLMGNVTKGDLITSNNNNPHDIIFDNIVIREMTPEELNAAAPELTVAQTIKLGENSVLTHSAGAAWNAASKTAYINETLVPADKVTYGADSVLLDKSLFPAAGSYAIVIKAAGMDDTKPVTQIVIGADGEFVKNGTFEGLAHWGSWFMYDDASGRLELSNGKLKVSSAGQNPEVWSIQVFQDAVPVSKGIEYTLSFEAKSSVATAIAMEFAGGRKEFELTPAVQKFTWVVTSGENSSKLNFLLATQSAVNNVYDIELDNISVKRSADVGTTPTATPTPIPTATPTVTPTAMPTVTPTAAPTATPTATPTPTARPTATPTAVPTARPTATPTAVPTATPVATPTAVPAVSQAPSPEQDGSTPVDIHVEDGIARFTAEADATNSRLQIESFLLLLQINKEDIDQIIIETEAHGDEVPALELTKAILNAARRNHKDISYAVNSESGKLLYEFTLDAENLAKGEVRGGLSLGIDIGKASENEAVQEILSKDKNNSEGMFLGFAQEEEFPAQSSVRLYVGAHGFEAMQKLYLYAVNTKTGKLESVPFGTTYQVDKDGYITFPLIEGGEYVLLPEKASKEVLTPLKEQIEVDKEKTLKPGAKTKVEVGLPATLEKVASMKEKASFPAKGRAVITYKSSNTSAATVDKSGTVTGKKPGKVTITTTVKLYTGKVYTYKTKVTIK
ncbi:beta-glucanase (GH16 family) [Anaerotaenia torta]|uniref:carbohydrate binding domain-containing protein n=1 Tax=Anaerotaenia torta TaxID=433293 RepID=UPI003D200597